MNEEQLAILQELSSRGDLSPDKKAIVDELMSRNAPQQAQQNPLLASKQFSPEEVSQIKQEQFMSPRRRQLAGEQARNILQEVSAGPAAAFSAFLAGAPRAMAKEEFPKAQTPAGKAAELAGQVAGTIAGPGKVAAGAMKAMKFIPRAVSAIAEGATVAAFSETENPEDFLDVKARINQAFSGALTAGVLKGGSNLIKGVGKASQGLAKRIVNVLLKPKQAGVSYGKDPARAVINEKITAVNLDDFTTKTLTKVNEVGKKIGDIVKGSDKKVDLSDITKPIDSAIKELAQNPRSNASAIKALQETKLDILGAPLGEDIVEDVLKKNFIGKTLSEAFDLKKQIASLTRFTGNQSDDKVVNAALRKTYNRVRDIMEKADKRLIPLNDRYADLKGLEVTLKGRAGALQGRSVVGLLAPIIGTGVGAAGGGLPGGVAAATAMAAGRTVPGTTLGARGLTAVGRGIEAGGKALERAITPAVSAQQAFESFRGRN